MDANADWVNGKIGKALDFDGTDDYVSSSRVLTQVPYTISAWIKPNTCGQDFQGNGIFYQGAASGQIGTVLSCTNIPGTTNYISFNNAEGGWVGSSSESVTLGVWQLVTATIDASGNVVIYVNGVVKGTGNSGTGAPANTSSFIGFWYDASASIRYFNGSLDDVRVYNRALSATEITNLYSRSSKAQKVKSGITNNGLVGHWSFEDATGTKATDFSGQGNTGTLTNMTDADWVNGKVGKALDLDGTDDYIDVAHNANMNFGTGNFSVSMWLNTSSDIDQRFLGKYDVNEGSPQHYWGFYMMLDGTRKMRFYAVSGGNSSNYAQYAFTPDGLWHLWTGVRSGTTLYLYKDGVQVATQAVTANDLSWTATLSIGRWGNYDAEYGIGQIDDVRLYNRAITSSEILGLYNQTKSTKVNSSQNNKLTDGLVGLWSFDGQDISGTNAYDRSGNNNTGTLTNGPTPVAGKIGQGMSFDGVDDYNVLPNSNAFDFGTGDFTFSTWIKSTSSSVGTIFVRYNTGGGAGQLAMFLNWATTGVGKIVLYTWNNASGDLYRATSSNVNDGNWHHIVGIRSGETISVYVDGVLNQGTQAGNATATVNVSSDADFYIGVNDNTPSTAVSYYDGVLDDFRMYNRTLSTSEIQMLYNTGR